jgi:hypothetical protein
MDYATVVSESLAIFKQYNIAMTLRQLFYRLVSKHVFPNTLQSYKTLSKMLVKARERGEVPDRYLEDRTRTTIGGDGGFEDPESFIDAYTRWFKNSWERFTMPLWANQPKRIEVWVEKDALSRLCSDASEEYNVITCPSKGYSSYSYVKRAVSRIASDYDGKNVTVLYFGDYDPSGVDIERDLGDRLARYGADNVEVKRIALTIEQIQKYNLPPFPAKSSDPRLAKFMADTGGTDAVELDALEPPVLTDLIVEAIQNHMDKDLWAERLTEMADRKEELRKKFEGLRVEFEGEGEDGS